MEKSLLMVHCQAGVRIITQILHSVSTVVLHLVKNFVPYLLLLPVWLCVALTFLVWSCVCWLIICISMTTEIFHRNFWKMIFIPSIKKPQDYPLVIKLKLLFMLSFMGVEMRNSLKSLKSILTKPKE